MTNDELKKYYQNLLIAQFNTMTKVRGHVGALVEQGIADQIISQVINGFDLETAVGAQLDIIGKYVGVNRRISGLDITREFFAMPAYADASPGTYAGMAAYGDSPTAYFRYYSEEGSSYEMNDAEMRDLIKLRIRKNTSDCSLADIDDIIDEFFGADCLVTDGMDMTLTYDFTPGLTYNLPAIAAFTNSLPEPAGVLVTITGI